MRITEVNLQNFKRFKELSVDISSDITLLLGPNSSGKSSLIKSILGLKQTVLPSNESEGLATQGDYVDLGTYNDFVYNHDQKKKVTLGFTIDGGQGAPLSIRSNFERYELDSARYMVTYDYNSITEQPRIYSLKISAYLKGNKNPLIIDIVRKKTRETYRLVIDKKSLEQSRIKIRRDQEKRVPLWHKGLDIEYVSRISFRRSARTSETVFDQAFSWLQSLQSFFYTKLQNEVFYLGPIRSHPSRNYIRTSHAQAVGPRGEHTASVLANLDKRQKKVTTGTSPLQAQYIFLKDALNLLFPGKGFTPQTIQELVRLEFYDSTNAGPKNRKGESIMDIGFGFSQVFPILVQLAVMPKGATLIIEQPELHLHPLAQTRLAKVFALAIKDNKRLIIETHSDHLVRGLQLELSESKKSNRNDGFNHTQIRILYTSESGDAPIKLAMNEWGEFAEPWPTGFMDVGYSTLMQAVNNKISR